MYEQVIDILHNLCGFINVDEEICVKMARWSHFDIATMHCRMQRNVAFRVVERDHLLARAPLGFPPLKEYLHRLRGGVLGCFVDRVVSVVARLAGAGAELGDLPCKVTNVLLMYYSISLTQSKHRRRMDNTNLRSIIDFHIL